MLVLRFTVSILTCKDVMKFDLSHVPRCTRLSAFLLFRGWSLGTRLELSLVPRFPARFYLIWGCSLKWSTLGLRFNVSLSTCNDYRNADVNVFIVKHPFLHLKTHKNVHLHIPTPQIYTFQKHPVLWGVFGIGLRHTCTCTQMYMIIIWACEDIQYTLKKVKRSISTGNGTT